MAWKNIKQRSLIDAMLIQHEKLSGLDNIRKIISWKIIDKHIVNLNNSKKGERAFSPLMIIESHI